MRATSFPLLENEPLVIVRKSFLTLCDGDQAAAALLNDFVYWHDWCLQHGRHDQTASLADPDHRSIDPECWFWKTVEDLSRDLLGGWGEKKIRAAVALIEAKGFAISRPNPINPWDRTKQYRLVVENLHSALAALAVPGADESGEKIGESTSASKTPTRSSKNAGWAKSTSYGDSSNPQIGRMHPAITPSLRTETTKSEITVTSSSAVGPAVGSTPLGTQTTNECPTSATADGGVETHRAPVCQGDDPLASVPLQWAQARGIQKRNPNGCIGVPCPDHSAEWTTAAHNFDIQTPDEYCAVLDHALVQADEISNKNGTDWEWWSYLTFRVEAAARVLAPRLRNRRAEPKTAPLVADLDGEPCSVTITLSNAGKARSTEEFAAWWRRLPAAQRIRYGGVCSPTALSDFDRSRQSLDNIAEPSDSTRTDATTGSAASNEESTEPGDALQDARRSPFQLSQAATTEECALRSHSQRGRQVTPGDASNA